MTLTPVDLAANVTITFWTALTGGSQITDLALNSDGTSPVTSVTTDANGEIPAFYGPSGVWQMAADANGGSGPRRWVYASDMGNRLDVLATYLKTLTG